MAVSQRTGELYYTDEEKEAALDNNNALQYAMSRGYALVHKGNEYRLKEHDSMVFLPDGRWYWNSQGKSGHALDFIQAYEGKSYTEAILLLAGTLNAPAPVGRVMQFEPQQVERKPFMLPERAENYRIMFAYLIKERGIDADLVKQLVEQHKIYQSKEHHNLVMVGFDSNNTARYASLRSTNSQGKPFKVDVTGSDKSYPFVIDGKADTDTVCVFESPIEAMSYWSLCKETGSDRINCNMISKGGATAHVALDRYLQEHPNTRNIMLGLNNDDDGHHKINAGLNGIKKDTQEYGDKYTITVHQPHLNDWNDVLKNYRHNLQQKMQEVQQRETSLHAAKKVHTVSKGVER